MWRLEREDGATAVVVGILMVVFIGFAAFSVDVGQLYQEKRELQNGADAAAMAGAHDCATGTSCPGAELDATVDEYANANANDGASAADVIDLTGSVAEGSITVRTTTIDPARNQPFLTHWFAGIFGEDSATTQVAAEATAGWTRIGGATTVPLAMSKCEWDNFTNGGTDYASEPYDPAAQQVVYFHGDAEPCHDSESGSDSPGGFGWLETDGTSCESDVTTDEWVPTDTGASASNGCDPEDLEAFLGTTILIPIYDYTNGLTGSNMEYHIYGFAAYYFTSYYLSGAGSEWNNALDGYPQPCSGSDRCVGGYFTHFVDIDGYADANSPYLGVVTVQLTG